MRGVVDQQMTSMAEEKRPRTPGLPYQQNHHKPRFQGFDPSVIDQETRDAEAVRPSAEHPALCAASRTAVKLTPMKQVSSSKVMMPNAELWAGYRTYAEAARLLLCARLHG